MKHLVAPALFILWMLVAPSSAQTEDDPRIPAAYDRVHQLSDSGQTEAAQVMADSLRAACEIEFGISSVQYGYSLDAWIGVQLDSGKGTDPATHEAAEQMWAIFEAEFEPDAAPIGRAQHLLGQVDNAAGDRNAAIEHYERAMAIRRQHEDLPGLASSTSSLAIALANLGRLAEARPHFEESVKIWEETLGPEHGDVGRGYQNLANIYRILGEFNAAVEASDRAINIFRKEYGPDSRFLAGATGTRGSSHLMLGNLRQARADYQTALELLPTEGPTAWRRAYHYSGLGLVEMQLGLFEDAQRHHRLALELFTEGVGAEHDLTTYPRWNLAYTTYQLGKLDEAVAHLTESRRILVDKLGESALRVAECDALLGRVETDLGRLDVAIPRLQRAVAVLDSTYADTHQRTAETRRFLATALIHDGQLEEALSVVNRAIDASEQGPRPGFSLASGLVVRSRIFAARNRLAESADDALRAESLSREDYRIAVQSLSERAGADFAQARSNGLRMALSALASGVSHDTIVRRAWDSVLRSRSLLLDEVVARRRSIAMANDELQPYSQAVFDARSRLATLYVRGDEGKPDEYSVRLAAAQAEKESAEAALAERSHAFRSRASMRAIGLDEVLQALPRDRAILAYVQYERETAPYQSETHYAAFLGLNGAVDYIDLGPATDVEAAVDRWRSTISQGNVPAGPLAHNAIASCRAAGEQLRSLILDPFQDQLRDARAVWIVPDAQLHLVNFAALPHADGGWLIEDDRVFHLLGAEREVTTPNPEPGMGLIAAGGPTYDTRHGEAPILALNLDPTDTFRGTPPDCDNFRNVRFPPLPGARLECERLGELWNQEKDEPLTLLLGPDATEARLKSAIAGHRLVHIATHGYVLDRGCTATGSDGRSRNPLLLGARVGGSKPP